MQEYNLVEWSHQESTKFFLSLVDEKVHELIRELLCFTDAQTISKDYFKTVGQIEGLQAVSTLINNNKKGD